MERVFVIAGSLLGFIAVAAGAFAAHGLRSVLEPQALATFEIGVRYQMYHALALIALGALYPRWPVALLRAAAVLFVAGTLLFSGSLYALTWWGRGWFGPVTPTGGVLLLAGWACVALAAVRAGRSV